jgi:hypothetical protein
VIGEAAVSAPRRRSGLSDVGLALSIVLAAIFAVIVEGLFALMLAHSATWRELAVLSLFAVPLLTGWVAIAIGLWSRPPWVRWSAAVLLLLVPPLVLLGVWNV